MRAKADEQVDVICVVNWWSMVIFGVAFIYMCTFTIGYYPIVDLYDRAVKGGRMTIIQHVFFPMSILFRSFAGGVYILITSYIDGLKGTDAKYLLLAGAVIGSFAYIIDYAVGFPVNFWFKYSKLTLSSLLTCIFWQLFVAAVLLFLYSRDESSPWNRLKPIYNVKKRL